MKNSLRLRNLLYLLLACALGLIIYKGYQAFEKISAFKKASHFYENNQFFESEPYFNQAYNNHWILYKDTKIRKSYERLSQVKRKLSSTIANAQNEYNNSNYMNLIKTADDYFKTKEKEKNDSVYLDFDKNINAQVVLLGLLNKAKKDLYKKMDDNIQDNVFKQEDFITLLGKLPDEMYEGSGRKSTELVDHFKKYDDKKYSSLGESLSFQELKDTINKEKTLYHDTSIDPYWLDDTLSEFDKNHEKEVAALEADQQKRMDELNKAKEIEKAKDPSFQEQIMSAVNDYAKAGIIAYNNLDTSYLVNATPEVISDYEEQFNQIKANNESFSGELLHVEYDLNSFKYSGTDGNQNAKVNVLLTMKSAVYTLGDDYELKETSTPWIYTLINNGDGWKISAKKVVNNFNNANSKVFDFSYDY